MSTDSALADSPPPYRAAAGVAALVLAGYYLTLAPTVTFWDAGEFIAATKTLGIPHPPGTPLFVLVAHVWALLVPIGEYAARTNLLSATGSAAAAGFFFLVLYEAMRGAGTAPKWLTIAGPAAAVIAGSFSFTHWQNSNETEVYSVSTFTIAAMMWLAMLWRRSRGTARAPRLLLLILYLAGLSIGTHLLALLAGPGIILFLALTLRDAPAADPEQRRREWAQLAVVTGVWALLIGSGLGSTTLTAVGGTAFVVAAAFAMTRGAGTFALVSVGLAAIGITPYLFMFLRAAQSPPINEAAPATFDALLAVIRRAQYPVRTPLDDPTVPHGPDNPGRSFLVLGVQLADYLVYYSWQWARGIRHEVGQVITAIVMCGLGLRGMLAHRRVDRGSWWMVFGVFLITGLGLVLYMNFKPGFGRWFDRFPQGGQHEVRERDYFFVVSFVVWGLWVGLGLMTVAAQLARRSAVLAKVAPAVLAIALMPLALNWTAASRRSGPDATLAADLAYNVLNSVPPYGILFTYGDNDTFPLWWAQEVEGVRQDVTVVCLALANTDWYMRQLRDYPTRALDTVALPAIWRNRIIPRPRDPLHLLDDAGIASSLSGFYAQDSQYVDLGPIGRVIPRGAFLYPNEILALSVIRQNVGRRPIVWSVTTPQDFAGLNGYVVQRGLGFELLTSPPDSVTAAGFAMLPSSLPVDVPATERLLGVYRYGRLLNGDVTTLETTSAAFASTFALPYTQLAFIYSDRGDRVKLEPAVSRAIQLSPQVSARAALAELRLQRN